MSEVSPEEATRGAVARIVDAARALIAERGADAATTRAVAARAGVQPPAIYRSFGDKRGLLDAVASAVLAEFVASRVRQPPRADPVDDLRVGWDLHVAFGLKHPELFVLISADLRPDSPVMAAGKEQLRRRVRRLARAGRLVVSEARALAMLLAGGTGTVLTLLKMPEGARDLELSTITREAVLTAMTGEARVERARGPRGAAMGLRASLEQTRALSDGERALLREWLDRIADAP